MGQQITFFISNSLSKETLGDFRTISLFNVEPSMKNDFLIMSGTFKT